MCETFEFQKLRTVAMSVVNGGKVHHIVGFILTKSEYMVQSFDRHSLTIQLLRQGRNTILA
jgi:hypothetical protein